MEILVWTCTVVLTLVGLAGVLLPVLPGTTLILIGVVLHKVFLPDQLSWAVVGWVTAFWLLSIVMDVAGVLIGIRRFGGSKWGMAGASGGALVGMFFSLPVLVLGTFLGAVVGERVFAQKTNAQSWRAGAGAAVGFVLSTVARLFCAFAMIAAFCFGVWSAVPVETF